MQEKKKDGKSQVGCFYGKQTNVYESFAAYTKLKDHGTH